MALDALSRIESATVELAGDAAPSEAEAAIEGADRVVIRFPTFKDGRGFSLAALLRRSGYEGELRAAGPLLPDQVDDLLRMGFDAVDIERPKGPARNRNTGGAPYVYQPDPGAVTARPAALHLRALAARKATAEALAKELEGATPEAILIRAAQVYGGRIAMLSSFGAEAALGLALVAEIASDTPILFLDTGMHFPQTLSYRDRLVSHLGLTNLHVLKPDEDEIRAQDPDGKLYDRDGLACCDLRKVRPLGRALDPFDALITGRKRYHGGQRGDIPAVEFDGERVKINPFAFLSPQDVAARYKALDLPRHPLAEDGYASIGCWPCTAPSDQPGSREGRWAGQDREECGIFDPVRAERAKRAGAIRLI
ncbi:phosphoadenylyl-sulfate reductase [Oceanicaulis sp. LC35]|uniref:phosphoadenylyl-sulfate reductase n=1 Tax=Oceanicaulis sp. LC35 TaxID=3349635 RepID=UPI003F84385C